SVNSITSQDPIALTGGTLSIASASTINSDLTVSSATLNVTGDLAVNGLLTLQGGTTLSGTGTVDAEGGLSLAGINSLMGTALINHAAATWQLPGGTTNGIDLYSGASIDNLAGASFAITGPDPLSGVIEDHGSGVSFINAGSFTASTGIDVNVNVPFANSGSV